MNDRDEALKELGRLVNERREEAGMTLEDIYDRTRIRMEYLHGIEEGNYSNFPEPVYTKGFIRTYLKLINAEDLQPEFMKQLDRTNAPKKQIQHEAPQKSKQNILGNGSKIPEGYKPTSHFWLFMVLTLALIGTGSYVWYAFAYGNLDVSKVFNFANRTGLNFTGSENFGGTFHCSAGSPRTVWRHWGQQRGQPGSNRCPPLRPWRHCGQKSGR